MDILQDFASALDRIDVQFESLHKSGYWKLWWIFIEQEYNNFIKSLDLTRCNGINEDIADLNLGTLREIARDTIGLLQKLLRFLYTVVILVLY